MLIDQKSVVCCCGLHLTYTKYSYKMSLFHEFWCFFTHIHYASILHFMMILKNNEKFRSSALITWMASFSTKKNLTSLLFTFSCALSTRVWLKQNQKKWVSIRNTLWKTHITLQKKTSFFILFSQVISVFFLFIHLCTFENLEKISPCIYFMHTHLKLIFNALCSDYTFLITHFTSSPSCRTQKSDDFLTFPQEMNSLLIEATQEIHEN